MRQYTFFTATKMRQNSFSLCPFQCIKRVLIICIYVMLHILKTDIFRHYTYISVRYIQHCAVLDYAVSCGFRDNVYTLLYVSVRYFAFCCFVYIQHYTFLMMRLYTHCRIV